MMHVRVTLYVEVTDEEALIRAARLQHQKEGMSGDEQSAREAVEDGDVGMALRLLLNPETSPPGTSIYDCGTDETRIEA